jgi:sulfopyruvate decarboxylase subunit beta
MRRLDALAAVYPLFQDAIVVTIMGAVAAEHGDGSLLMNLGGLTTLARYRPRNMVHVVFDNESLLSVGGFPTATSTGSDLAAIAAAAGVPRTATATTIEAFATAFEDALGAGDLTTIVAKVEAVGPSGFVTDLNLLENRFSFARALRREQTA